MKKYKLLKDLPGYNAGEVFANEELEIRKYYASNGTGKSFSIFSMGLGKLSEWFEEIKEEEECKHENVHTECANCGGKPQPKQLPSNEIEKDVEKFIKGGISPEYASYSAIVRFLDEHFKY